MPISYLQSPASAVTQYQVDTTGDSYTLVTGDPNNSDTNLGVATVVNYSVAANIQNNAGSWPSVTPTFFNEKKSTLINALTSTKKFNEFSMSYYAVTKSSFAAVASSGGSIFDQGGTPVWVEQITINNDSLEYAVLRNNNPIYVENFSEFLKKNAEPIGSQTYFNNRTSALSQILSGGGFGNPNRFFVVRNLVTRYGRVQRNAFGFPPYGDNGNYEIYEKQNSGPAGVNGMNPVVSYTPEPGRCGVWLTNVYVDTTSGIPIFSFPNGGTTTRGEQFYRNIVTSFLQSAELDG